MHKAALEILHYLDNIAENRKRRDMILAAAVSSGAITAIQAWPEYFPGDEGDPVFPSTDADTSAFRLEEATPQSFAADMAALIRASEHVALPEEGLPERPQLPIDLPDTEWT